MQDFNYVHSNTFEITLELSCCKVVPSETLRTEWDNNKEALYKFIEAAQYGVKGIVSDEQGKPIKNAKIHVDGIDHPITTNSDGEYWRLLLPGKYKIQATHGR
jgi:protocatechuate 3,4-dioxygenase beta subunit